MTKNTATFELCMGVTMIFFIRRHLGSRTPRLVVGWRIYDEMLTMSFSATVA